MNLKPWLAYAQKTFSELQVSEDAFAATIADLAESWNRQLAGAAKPVSDSDSDSDSAFALASVHASDSTSDSDATSASALILSPPDDIPISEAILHLSALQPQHQALQKNSGQYFTPLNLAEYLLNATVRTEFGGKGLTFLDPACGSGVFLYVAAHMAARAAAPDGLDTARKRVAFVSNSLFGIEKDPHVARLARATLTAWILEGQGGCAGAAEGIGVRDEDEDETEVVAVAGAGTEDTAEAGSNAFTFKEATQIVSAKILCDDALLGDAWRCSHFDYVVGNPPFLGVRKGRIPDSEKTSLEHRFKTAHGQFDLYALFVEDALTRIKEGGSIAFVLPRPLLSNDYSAPLRDLLARQTTIRQILDFGKPFQAGVEIIGLIASGNSATSTVTKPEAAMGSPSVGSTDSDSDLASANAGSAGHTNIRKQQELPVMLFHASDNRLADLIGHLSAEFPPLGDLTVSWRGLEFGKKDAAITESRISADALPILRGSDVRRYAIKTPTRFYSPVEEPAIGGVQERRTFSNKFPAGKLLVRRVFPRLAAAYDPDPNLTLNTVYILMTRPDYAKTPCFSYFPWFLLGIINSGIASFWFKNAFIFRETLFPYVRLSQLRRLPCPPPDHPYAGQLGDLAHDLSQAYKTDSATDCEVLQKMEHHLEILLADMLELSESERNLIQSRSK